MVNPSRCLPSTVDDVPLYTLRNNLEGWYRLHPSIQRLFKPGYWDFDHPSLHPTEVTFYNVLVPWGTLYWLLVALQSSRNIRINASRNWLADTRMSVSLSFVFKMRYPCLESYTQAAVKIDLQRRPSSFHLDQDYRRTMRLEFNIL